MNTIKGGGGLKKSPARDKRHVQLKFHFLSDDVLLRRTDSNSDFPGGFLFNICFEPMFLQYYRYILLMIFWSFFGYYQVGCAILFLGIQIYFKRC